MNGRLIVVYSILSLHRFLQREMPHHAGSLPTRSLPVEGDWEIRDWQFKMCAPSDTRKLRAPASRSVRGFGMYRCLDDRSSYFTLKRPRPKCPDSNQPTAQCKKEGQRNPQAKQNQFKPSILDRRAGE